MNKKIHETLRKKYSLPKYYLLMGSILLSAAKLYGVDNYDAKRSSLYHFIPESFFNLLGIASIILGAFQTWRQKSVQPLIFFGGIGAAIMMIF